MLDHVFTLNGPQYSAPKCISFQSRPILIHPSADSILVSNALDLKVIQSLPFWEAFPATLNGSFVIRSFAVDEADKLIVASLGYQAVVWCTKLEDGSNWQVHSTIVERGDITSMDCWNSAIVVGTAENVSIFRRDSNSDFPSWVRDCEFRMHQPSIVRISPTSSHLACASSVLPTVQIFDTRTRCIVQQIRHPRPVLSLTWRTRSATSTRDDLVLFTQTPDFTVRIFMPVLDAPNLLQLHASVDRYQFLSDPLSSEEGSAIFWLDRGILLATFSQILDHHQHKDSQPEHLSRLKDILDQGWDLFGRVLSDGTFAIRAVANIDRRPPTMLRQFNVLHTVPNCFPPSPHRLPSHILMTRDPTTSAPSLILLSSAPLRSYRLNPLALFNNTTGGLIHLQRSWDSILMESRQDFARLPGEHRIRKFVRTPEGEAVGVIRDDGSLDVWKTAKRGYLKALSEQGPKLAESDTSCLFNDGFTIATYSNVAQALTVHHYAQNTHSDSKSPHTESISLHTPQHPVLFALQSLRGATPLICATTSVIHLILVILPTDTQGSQANLQLKVVKTASPTLPDTPALLLPLDLMVWNPPEQTTGTIYQPKRSVSETEREAFATLSSNGELSFWVLHGLLGEHQKDQTLPSWRCSSTVHTNRTQIAMAQCSSTKKTALVVEHDNLQELTIWDSVESEFSSGMEYSNVFSDRICDLDWTSTSDGQSILALGFARRVLMLCPQRMNYFDEAPSWAVLHTIDIAGLTPNTISDSVWLSRETLLIGAGHQMFMFGEPPSIERDSSAKEGLLERVALQNGPLATFHPQLILQCLLWDKIELVKEIICDISHNLSAAVKSSATEEVIMREVPLWKFWDSAQPNSVSNGATKQHFAFLSDGDEEPSSPVEEVFSRNLVAHLVEILERHPLPHLTPSEMEHLIVLIQTTLEIDEQRRSLDANGLRYLISIRSFFIINKRVTEPRTHSKQTAVLAPFVRERIRYRDVIWAFHSESQEILTTASTAACGGKMLWLDARALGVFLWGTSNEMLRNQMETIARNQYMNGEARDPTACCLFYFALGKIKLVQGLWKQAAWHKEQSVMLKFLANDFSELRWQTAALKNAFALLSKQRHEYAAAFFLLGGSLKDAVNVCLKQLQDFQLAVALARVVEGDDGPIFQQILRSHVIPRAFKEGNRWLGSWAFWMMRRRDLAVRILLTPLKTFSTMIDIPINEVGDPHYDDPSLALLFSQLKGKSLQTAKGTSEISGRTEFNFVLQMSRVLCRMGCHVLALDLVRSWSFDRPTMLIQPTRAEEDLTEALDDRLLELSEDRRKPSTSPTRDRKREGSASRSRPPPSPTMRRTSMQLIRRQSLLIDMEIPSLPPTRPATPVPEPPLPKNGSDATDTSMDERGRVKAPPDTDRVARQTGLGTLMKSAKKDVAVPEFDMGNFF